MKVSPANRRGLNIGLGRRARLIREHRSASAGDRMPSATWPVRLPGKVTREAKSAGGSQ